MFPSNHFCYPAQNPVFVFMNKIKDIPRHATSWRFIILPNKGHPPSLTLILREQYLRPFNPKELNKSQTFSEQKSNQNGNPDNKMNSIGS